MTWDYTSPDGSTGYERISIGPELYFVTNDAEDKCYLTIVTVGDTCWLGQPFFRKF